MQIELFFRIAKTMIHFDTVINLRELEISKGMNEYKLFYVKMLIKILNYIYQRIVSIKGYIDPKLTIFVLNTHYKSTN